MSWSVKEIWMSKAELSKQFFNAEKDIKKFRRIAIVVIAAWITFTILGVGNIPFMLFLSLTFLIALNQVYIAIVFKENIKYYSSLKYKMDLMDEKIMKLLEKKRK